MFRFRTIIALLVLLAVVGAVSAYRAARTVPEFYHQVLELPPQQAEAAGEEFAASTLELSNRVRLAGIWSAQFTDEQVNGWLATEMPEKHPELLPVGFTQPRVRFAENRLQLGVQSTASGVETVVWLDIEVSMTDEHEAALRFRQVRAGSLPLPLGHVLDALTQVAKDLEVPLRWTTVDDDPTALLGLPTLAGGYVRYELDKLKVSDGLLFVSGRTVRAKATSPGTAAR